MELILELAQKAQDDDMDLMSHLALAGNGVFRGEISSAHAHAETVTNRYDRERHSSLAAIYSQEDPGVSAGGVDT